MTPGERALRDALVASGYVVLRRGWPDFLVIGPQGETFAVEWKEIATRDRLTVDQERMHEAFALMGIPTLVTGSIGDVFSFRPRPQHAISKAVLRGMRGRGEA